MMLMEQGRVQENQNLPLVIYQFVWQLGVLLFDAFFPIITKLT